MNEVKQCFGNGLGWIRALNRWSVQERAQINFCPITRVGQNCISPFQKPYILYVYRYIRNTILHGVYHFQCKKKPNYSNHQ